MYSVSDSRCNQSTARLGTQQEASFLYQILPEREAEYLDVLEAEFDYLILLVWLINWN